MRGICGGIVIDSPLLFVRPLITAANDVHVIHEGKCIAVHRLPRVIKFVEVIDIARLLILKN